MHIYTVLRTKVESELTDRLEKGQRLDVTDGTANLDDADIGITGAQPDTALDLVRDVRDDLHGRTQIVATAFLGYDAAVDPSGGEIAVAPGRGAHEALVMAQIEVGFGPVGGNEYFAVLERTHGARIDIEVGVELDHRDLEAAGFEDGAERGGRYALAQRRNDAASHENIAGHGTHLRRPTAPYPSGVRPGIGCKYNSQFQHQTERAPHRLDRAGKATKAWAGLSKKEVDGEEKLPDRTTANNAGFRRLPHGHPRRERRRARRASRSPSQPATGHRPPSARRRRTTAEYGRASTARPRVSETGISACGGADPRRRESPLHRSEKPP